MTPFSIAVLAFSMSADACAAAMARGAATRPHFWSAIRSGAVFGTIEAITPLLGWALGLFASRYIAAIDHWVAFILLGGVGGKMAFESIRRLGHPEDAEADPRKGGILSLVLTAFATSIDAAAVGVTLALVSVNIVSVALAIGAATFTMATAGLLVGRAVGARFGPVVELIGGLGLIAIGAGILIEHTGFLG
ncbi:MAG TPA: manganese efflux pump MntP family protein [Sphingomicrobium sp.]|nr:manganese efflux pump MntP family protein [Sphingomicrobium sp.]